MSKKLTPERLTEHLRTLRLAAHGNPFAAIAVIETAEHIEALETETTARGKVWAEQTVQRCDATAKIEALEAELSEAGPYVQLAKEHSRVAVAAKKELTAAEKELAEARAELSRLRNVLDLAKENSHVMGAAITQQSDEIKRLHLELTSPRLGRR